jgi:exopolysaccharide production protein ExoZ
MIVAGALFVPPFKVPLLQHVGDASYSLYLSHTITLAAFASMWAALAFPKNAILFACVGFALSVLVASCVFRLVERPLTVALKGTSRRRRPASLGEHSRTVVPYLKEGDSPEIATLGDPAR